MLQIIMWGIIGIIAWIICGWIIEFCNGFAEAWRTERNKRKNDE